MRCIVVARAQLPHYLSSMTPELEATLLKLRKQTTTGLSDKKLKAAYAYLGITQVEGVSLQPIKDIYLTYSSFGSDEGAVHRWAKNVEVGKSPAKPVAGHIYAAKAAKITERPSPWDAKKVITEAAVPPGSLVGTPSKLRTVPGAGSLLFVSPIRWSRGSEATASGYFDAVDRDLLVQQQARIVELASHALGIAAPHEEKAAKKRAAVAEKVAKGGGICGVCFNAHKVYASGVTYPHGYKMNTKYARGHAGAFKQPGQCPGAQRGSWENGPHTTAWYATDLRSLAQNARKKLAEIKAGQHPDIVVFRAPPRYGRPGAWRLGGPWDMPEHGETRDILHPGDALYPEADKQRRDAHKQTAEAADASAAWYEKAAAGWPTLPG